MLRKGWMSLCICIVFAFSNFGVVFGETIQQEVKTTEINADTGVYEQYVMQQGPLLEANGSDDKLEDTEFLSENLLSNAEQEDVIEDEGTEESEKQREERLKKEAAEEKKLQAEKEAILYQEGLAAYIRSKNKNLSKKWSMTLAGYFIEAGQTYDLDPKILMALALRESGFRAKIKSPYGYKGMMQTSDGLAKRYGYKASDLYEAKVSIDVAARYLKTLKKKYKTYTKSICAYVCGSGAVSRGVYSKEPGRSVVKVRGKIQTYLEEKGYVTS